MQRAERGAAGLRRSAASAAARASSGSGSTTALIAGFTAAQRARAASVASAPRARRGDARAISTASQRQVSAGRCCMRASLRRIARVAARACRSPRQNRKPDRPARGTSCTGESGSGRSDSHAPRQALCPGICALRQCAPDAGLGPAGARAAAPRDQPRMRSPAPSTGAPRSTIDMSAVLSPSTSTRACRSRRPIPDAPGLHRALRLDPGPVQHAGVARAGQRHVGEVDRSPACQSACGARMSGCPRRR